MTYNSKRNILGAITLGEKTAYHLFDIGYSKQKGNYSAKLLKKFKWHPEYSTRHRIYQFLNLSYPHIANFLSSFDFNPSGEVVATLDRFGVCLVSDVNTNEDAFSLELGTEGD